MYMAHITRALLALLCIAMPSTHGAEKVRVTMCINSAVQVNRLNSHVLDEAKTQIQIDLATAARVSRYSIPLEAMTLTNGCITPRKQAETSGYTVAFDILETDRGRVSYRGNKPIVAYRELVEQSEAAGSTFRTQTLVARNVVPGSLRLVCQVWP